MYNSKANTETLKAVEWYKVKDICNVVGVQRKFNKKEYLKDGLIPIIDQGKKYIIAYTNYEDSSPPLGEYVIFGDHTREVKYVDFKFVQGADGLKILKCNEILLPKYLYYLLCNMDIEDKGYSRHWSLVKEKIIPVPAIDIQRDIIRRLDELTLKKDNLINSLLYEKDRRMEQLEFYRNRLISLSEEDSYFTELGKIARVHVGKKPKSILSEKTQWEYINAGTSNSGYTCDSNCDGDTVTTPSRGQGGIGHVSFQSKPFWLGPLCYMIRATSMDIENKYLFYYIQSKRKQILDMKKEAGVPAVNRTDLIKMKVQIPPLNRQRMIISLLDSFSSKQEEICQCILSEVDKRVTQYDFYRDALLLYSEKNRTE